MKKKIFLTVLAGISALSFACGIAACGTVRGGEGESELWSIGRVYAKAQELGFEGTLDELIEMFKGDAGEDGRSITDVKLDENGNLIVSYSDGTKQDLGKIKGEDGKTGPQGPQGGKGDDGKSAYDIWKENGHSGTEEDFLAWLRGEGAGGETDGTQGLLYRMKKSVEGDYLVVAGLGTAWETDIVVPETWHGLPVKGIGYGAFADAYEGRLRSFITSVSLPASIRAIGDGAFFACSLLERVTFAERSALKSVGNGAFEGCSSLTEIILPAGIETVGDHVFNGCSSLGNIYYLGTPTQWKALGIDASNNSVLAATPCWFFSQEAPTAAQWEESDFWWRFTKSGEVEKYIKQETPAFDELNIYFPELGNGYAGDCVLIKVGDTEALIDAGSRKSSAKTLVPYIAQYCTDGILEYVIATHAHQDHIAAFVGESGSGIFANFQCKTIIDYARKNSASQISKDYEAARDAEVAATEGAVHYTALQCWNETDGAQRSYELGNGVTMNILYNYYYEHSTSDENDYSVCMLLSQGENHFLFTGDLEESGEKYLVQYNPDLPHVKLFKAGHHGSKTSSNEVLLEKITPEIVCVCCCAGSTEYTTNKDNTFPTQDMINRVAKYTKSIYVTTMSTVTGYASMNGDITVTSSSEGVTVHGDNNDTILKETEWFKANRTWPQDGVM